MSNDEELKQYRELIEDLVNIAGGPDCVEAMQLHDGRMQPVQCIAGLKKVFTTLVKRAYEAEDLQTSPQKSRKIRCGDETHVDYFEYDKLQRRCAGLKKELKYIAEIRINQICMGAEIQLERAIKTAVDALAADGGKTEGVE